MFLGRFFGKIRVQSHLFTLILIGFSFSCHADAKNNAGNSDFADLMHPTLPWPAACACAGEALCSHSAATCL